MNKEYYAGLPRNASSLQQKTGIFLLTVIVFFLGQLPPLFAEQPGVLQGRIINSDEGPVSHAEVYVFDSPDVKRPANFKSNRTVADGRYTLQLPPGNYWAVAIFRQGETRFGPLLPGDMHSGEAVAFEIAAGVNRTIDFMVVNLRAAAMQQQKKKPELIRITGKVINETGKPVAMAYAMAHKLQQLGALPEYVSPWTDKQGTYSLYLPPGRYYLGASVGFPPKHGYILYLDQQFIEDTDKVDLVVDKVKQ